ncbi:MAG: glycerol-3-phosphate dehydrogenase [Coriobacteriia bacterium]|nr:glycerol-3-phosphate dehydrogenase [Coriobacteriia bacterium]
MSVVTVIGSGQMATALSFPAFENGNEVRLVGTHLDREIIDELRKSNYHLNLKRKVHEGVKFYQIEEAKEALTGADLVLCGVSSFGVEWYGKEILPILDENVPMISVTKGLMNQGDGKMICYPEYWKSQLREGSKLVLNAIGGPCEAKCLADHVPSYVAYCGPDMEILKKIKKIFSTDYYIISLTQDVVGLEVSVALKNAYALATALAVGMAEKENREGVNSWNAQSALFMQGVKEMYDLLPVFGGSQDKIMYAAGDCHVTSQGGRSRKVGVLLGKGYTIDEALEQLKGETLEAVVIAKRTGKAVCELGEMDKYPLLMHVYELLTQGITINMPWKKFETIN